MIINIRPVFYIAAISLLAIVACNSGNGKEQQQAGLSITGKWHRFSMENGYTEFDIDSQNVVFYNQKVGRFKLPYKIEHDSLIYLTKPYAAKIISYGDSIVLAGNDSTKATLHRFNQADSPFNTIPEEQDSLAFASYQKGFDVRLVEAFRKAGIQLSDGTNSSAESEYERLLSK